jgi:hypothetical protein
MPFILVFAAIGMQIRGRPNTDLQQES